MNQNIMARSKPFNFSLSVSLLFHTMFILLLGQNFLLETAPLPKKVSQTEIRMLARKTPPHVVKQMFHETQIEKSIPITPVEPQALAPAINTKAAFMETAIASPLPVEITPHQTEPMKIADHVTPRALLIDSPTVSSAFSAMAEPQPVQTVALKSHGYGRKALVQSGASTAFTHEVKVMTPQLPSTSSGIARRVARVSSSASVQKFAPAVPEVRVASQRRSTNHGRSTFMQSEVTAFAHEVKVTTSKMPTTSSGVSRRVARVSSSASVQEFAPAVPEIRLASQHRTVGHGRSTLMLNRITPFPFQGSLPRSPTQLTDAEVLKGYLQIIQRNIVAAKRYPERERQALHEGRMKVAFTLLKNGEIESLRLKQKSKHARLNQAALEAVSKVVPFSGFPAGILEDAIDVVIPFRFELN